MQRLLLLVKNGLKLEKEGDKMTNTLTATRKFNNKLVWKKNKNLYFQQKYGLRKLTKNQTKRFNLGKSK